MEEPNRDSLPAVASEFVESLLAVDSALSGLDVEFD